MQVSMEFFIFKNFMYLANAYFQELTIKNATTKKNTAEEAHYSTNIMPLEAHKQDAK